jgi:hypothetical protein
MAEMGRRDLRNRKLKNWNVPFGAAETHGIWGAQDGLRLLRSGYDTRLNTAITKKTTVWTVWTADHVPGSLV